MTVVAAIDCGTNSIRLLVAEPTTVGLRELHREMRIVRLGQDVDRTGRLAPDAIARTAAVLADYRRVIDRFGAGRVRLVATSATRDATNRDEFEALVRRTLGVPADVVSGADEAALSFAGAASAAPQGASLIVADIGGGSTELVRGGHGPLWAYSMNVGAVRMTERHLADDPPTASQIEAVESDVLHALATARTHVPLDAGATLVGVAGTVTTVAALTLGLRSYERELIHGATLTREQIDEVTDRLVQADAEQRAAMTVIHPGRRDVIAAGALILRTLVDDLGVATMTVSERDILDGIALGLAR